MLAYRHEIGPNAPMEEPLECATCPVSAYSLDEEGRCERCVSGVTKRESDAELEAAFMDHFSLFEAEEA